MAWVGGISSNLFLFSFLPWWWTGLLVMGADLLQPGLDEGGGSRKPDWKCQNTLNDGRVEVHHDTPWDVELVELAFLVTEVTCMSHFNVLVMAVPRNLNDSSTDTAWPLISRGRQTGMTSKISPHFHCFGCITVQVVPGTPCGKMTHFFVIGRLMLIGDESHYH